MENRPNGEKPSAAHRLADAIPVNWVASKCMPTKDIRNRDDKSTCLSYYISRQPSQRSCEITYAEWNENGLSGSHVSFKRFTLYCCYKGSRCSEDSSAEVAAAALNLNGRSRTIYDPDLTQARSGKILQTSGFDNKVGVWVFPLTSLV